MSGKIKHSVERTAFEKCSYIIQMPTFMKNRFWNA